MKNKLLITLVLAVLMQTLLVGAQNIYSTNYPDTSMNPSQAQFIVKELKYEPYPVNAGSTFDVWIKVQNAGQQDANNAEFELIPSYPFSSNDSLVRDYGIVSGTLSASKQKLSTETAQSNQIVMKFRVHVDDNAAAGESNLQIKVMEDKKTNVAVTYNLPIDIEKTKTNFDIRLNSISAQETSFTVINIGDKDAKAVILDVEKQDQVVSLQGEAPSSLGEINSGDTALAHLKIVPKSDEVTLKITYTDTAGVRSSIVKTVAIDASKLERVCAPQSNNDYMKWFYGLGGLVTGIFVVVLIVLIAGKARAKNK
jgi:hypothetical protein